ncbi:MAG: UDP-N-acetyl-D-glucosamine dehydrogenase, partial [Luteitalea sp.]|nr:UDP-N-acetyl-D-glucosamine dehydrogenase [Luteitalea sp.]
MTESATFDDLLRRIGDRTARAGVVGLGYVGLPLAVELARAGLQVTGIDLDETKVDAVNAGRSYIADVLSTDLESFGQTGSLTATTDFAIVAELDTITICVPTPLRKTKDPDLSFVVSAVEQIAPHLHAGMLVLLESTTYPGTTQEVVQTILEQTGLRAGR